MSSVQTGQLISLLTNNVLMVIIVMVVAAVAWLRWHWLRASADAIARRRCRWAYVSFVLTVATLLGMLTSLSVLTLRAMVAINALVMGAMGIFLLSVITLLLALSLWFVDLCWGLPALPMVRPSMIRRSVVRQSRKSTLLPVASIALLPAAMATSNRRRRAHRRQRR